MKHSARAFRSVRLSEETNNLINTLETVCKESGIRMNGDGICGSVILRYPFEKIAHAQFRDEKIEKLTDLLFLAHGPSDNFGNPLTREQIKDIVKGVFK